MINDVYLDIETERWSDEVEGGWRNISAFGMALAVTFDGPPPGFTCWGNWAPGHSMDPATVAQALIQHLLSFDRIITFNGERFDFKVLSAYGDVSGLYARSLDVLRIAEKELGHRISLDSLSRATLGRGKSGDGRQAVNWLREGTGQGFHQAVSYCIGDVMLLMELVYHGRCCDKLFFFDRHGDLRTMSYREPPMKPPIRSMAAEAEAGLFPTDMTKEATIMAGIDLNGLEDADKRCLVIPARSF